MKIIKIFKFWFLLTIVCTGCQKKDVSIKTEEAPHIYNPSDYILTKYDEGTDVVILGDHHFIKENVDFVSKLIPKLHKKGIRLFYSEFQLHQDSLLFKDLMRKPYFDAELAKKINHNNLWQWGYQEYVDLLNAVWEVNHKLPEDEWIRVIGTTPYWPWEVFQTEEDFNNPEKRKLWDDWDGLPYEKKWAQIVAEGSLEEGKKAFVFCGFHHGMTEYKQPIVIEDEFFRFETERMGHYLFNKYGKRVKTILTHYPWPGKEGYGSDYVIPFQGSLDSMFIEYGSFGLDTYQLPYLIDSSSVYSRGYKKLRLPQLCDGYVVVEPICKQNVLTPIPNFVNENNLKESKRQYHLLRDQKYSAQAFNDSIKTWLSEIKRDMDKACNLEN